MISDRTRTFVVAIVTFVWAINFGFGLFSESYNPSESINGIFTIVVGGMFAITAKRGSSDSSKNEGEDKSKDLKND